jgi:hypothetical protein
VFDELENGRNDKVGSLRGGHLDRDGEIENRCFPIKYWGEFGSETEFRPAGKDRSAVEWQELAERESGGSHIESRLTTLADFWSIYPLVAPAVRPET